MTEAEILAELQRLRSVPGIADVARAAGVRIPHLWQIIARRRPVTLAMAQRLAPVLRHQQQQLRVTFGVSPR